MNFRLTRVSVASALLAVSAIAQSVNFTFRDDPPSEPTTAALLAVPSPAPSVNLTFDGVSPREPVTWHFTRDNLTGFTYAGLMRFSATGGNESLYTFCIDIAQNVTAGANHSFITSALTAAPVTIGSGGPMGASKADNLSVLFGHVFGSDIAGYTPLSVLDTDAKQQGFQFAVWNIVYDSDSSVFGGDFRVEASSPSINVALDQADAWLRAVGAAEDGSPRMKLSALSSATFQDQVVPVPEPSTYAALLAVGSFGIVLLHRRLRNRVA